jgi:hypothetical protein
MILEKPQDGWPKARKLRQKVSDYPRSLKGSDFLSNR